MKAAMNQQAQNTFWGQLVTPYIARYTTLPILDTDHTF